MKKDTKKVVKVVAVEQPAVEATPKAVIISEEVRKAMQTDPRKTSMITFIKKDGTHVTQSLSAQKGRPVNPDSDYQKRKAEHDADVAAGLVAGRGRPVNPDSPHYKAKLEKQALVDAGLLTGKRGRPADPESDHYQKKLDRYNALVELGMIKYKDQITANELTEEAALALVKVEIESGEIKGQLGRPSNPESKSAQKTVRIELAKANGTYKLGRPKVIDGASMVAEMDGFTITKRLPDGQIVDEVITFDADMSVEAKIEMIQKMEAEAKAEVSKKAEVKVIETADVEAA